MAVFGWKTLIVGVGGNGHDESERIAKKAKHSFETSKVVAAAGTAGAVGASWILDIDLNFFLPTGDGDESGEGADLAHLMAHSRLDAVAQGWMAERYCSKTLASVARWAGVPRAGLEGQAQRQCDTLTVAHQRKADLASDRVDAAAALEPPEQVGQLYERNGSSWRASAEAIDASRVSISRSLKQHLDGEDVAESPARHNDGRSGPFATELDARLSRFEGMLGALVRGKGALPPPLAVNINSDPAGGMPPPIAFYCHLRIEEMLARVFHPGCCSND